MDRPSREFVNVDDLMRRVSVEDVMRYYGVVEEAIHRIGGEIRTRCFLNCSKTEPTGDRTLAIKVDDDAKRWCCHRYGCEHKQGGNLLSLIDLVKSGEHTINEHELNELARGWAGSLLLNFGLCFLSIFFTLVATLIVVPIAGDRTYYSFFIMTVVSIVTAVICIVLWIPTFRRSRRLAETIRERMPPPPGIQEVPS